MRILILFMTLSLNVSAYAAISLEELSEHIDEIRNGLELQKGKDVYLTGGTALSVINHIITDEKIDIKDLDIALIDASSSEYKATKLSSKLQSFGKSTEKQVVSKPWLDGFGFFHTHNKSNMLIDVVLSPSKTTLLENNGILNIERVKIKIKRGESLLSIASKIKLEWHKTPKLESIKNFRNIIDPNDGFMNWKRKTPSIVLHKELVELPIIASMRIIRSHVKIDAALSPELKSILKKSLSKKNISFDRKRATRHFTYFFGDDRLVDELLFAESTGLIKHLYPSLSAFLKKKSHKSLKRFFKAKRDTKILSLDELRIEKIKPLLDTVMTETEKTQTLFHLESFYKGLLTSKSSSSLMNKCTGLLSKKVTLSSL